MNTLKNKNKNKNKCKSKGKGKGRGYATRGWKKDKPNYHQRTVMLQKCGKKCFLGPNKKFPICKKNTCKISRTGIQSAYIRAQQYKYLNIAKKARKLTSFECSANP